MDIAGLALAIGSSFSAGLNLYLTVLSLGLMHRFDVFALPANLQVLAHPWVLVCAAILLTVEFVADKVPYLDNAWDAVHSLVRIPAGAALAAASLTEVPTHILWIAGLVGGVASFTSHGAKASTRLAVNSTPEPFSNWFLSLGEDGLSLGLLWLVANHPYLALGTALLLLVVAAVILYLFFRFLKRLFRVATVKNPRSVARKLPLS